jgi:hypothetical protein
MNSLKEKKILVRMKQRLGEEVPQSLLDEIAEEEAQIIAEQEKQAALQEERKNAFKGMFSDLSSQLGQLMAEEKKKTAEEQAILDRFSNVLSRVDEIKSQIQERKDQPTEEFIEEIIDATPPVEVPIIEEVEPKKNTIIAAAVQHVKETAQAPSMFVQPEPPVVGRDIKDIQQKLRMLEGWVSKISMTGPGGGEVNFRYLDDVARDTMTPSNDNWVLEYDAATKKVQFTEHIGPIRSIKMNTSGPSTTLVAGQMAWNAIEDCLDIKQGDGSILQAGLENYIQVRNSTGVTLTNGSVVRFSGVFTNADYIPECVLHIADGTVPPLYTIGVLTNDIPANGIGRATLLGKVREIDTTGSSVSETWVAGDILYVSPTYPGELTKVKPTAPNVVVAVAAVLKADATGGVLLVRPTIFPRLYYGSFSDTTNQSAAVANTAYPVTINTANIANGHRLANASRIVADNSGLYNYQFSLQFTSTNSSGKEVYVWARKNGVDIQNTAGKLTIAGNGTSVVFASNYVISMNASDYFEFMWATTDPTASIVAPTATSFCPSTPSAIVIVTEAAL